MSTVTLIHDDCKVALRRLIDEGVRVHSIVTDPPYGLISIRKRFGGNQAPARTEGNDGSFARLSGGFMGKAWDATGIEHDVEFWRLCLEILLPGGYLLAFSSPRTGHRMACAIEDAGFIMHPFIGWAYGCLDDQTECLTRRGWLKYTDILPDDEVLQWDNVTDTLTWTKPSAVHVYDFDGDMVTIRNRHTRQVLTPNHRVYAKIRRHSRHPKPTEYEVVEARDVYNRPGNWSVDLPLASFLRDGDNIDPDYAYLVGWWLTDAWAHRDANACMFSQCKPETLDKLRSALERYGANEYVRESKNPNHSNEHSFYLTGSMADKLRREFPNRDLPWSVLSWSFAARRRLYEGLIDGDGSRNKLGHNVTFWSRSQKRRDVFVALAISIGLRAYDDPTKGAVYVNHKRRTTQIQWKHRSDKVRYSGKVWCLTVPTGAFVVRREGRPFITGNSGFPKAHAADKAIDKALGKRGTLVPSGNSVRRIRPGADQHKDGTWEKLEDRGYQPGSYIPATAEAAQWSGWAYGGQARKPALEPIYVAQRPFSEKNGALNILKHGVGAVNIDGCRVPVEERALIVPGEVRLGDGKSLKGSVDGSLKSGVKVGKTSLGRYPANLIHDGSPEVVVQFPRSDSARANGNPNDPKRGTNHTPTSYGKGDGAITHDYRDTGSASRFFECYPFDDQTIFYHSKATCADRAGSRHPTVKPIGLLRALVRHVTPPGGIVLDPFAGTGTTGEAARLEGCDSILIEFEPEYVADIERRFGIETPAYEYLRLLGLES